MQLLHRRGHRQDPDRAVVLREPSPVRTCPAQAVCALQGLLVKCVRARRRTYDYENFVWAVQLPKVREPARTRGCQNCTATRRG